MKKAAKSDWQTQDMPARQSKISVKKAFSESQIRRIQAGLIPEEMEDKWFIYWQDDNLYFHRSWTGDCIYVVRFEAIGNSFEAVEAAVNRDPEQYTETDNANDAKMISYLIDVLLLGNSPAFPIGESDSGTQALMQWSQIGRAMLGQQSSTDSGAEPGATADGRGGV